MARIAVLGENVVDCVVGEHGQLHSSLGGSPLNVALALSRQQHQVCYLSPLSADHFGDAFARLLQHEQITLGAARSSRPSSLAIVHIDSQGQPHYSLYRQGIADRDITLAALCAAVPPDTQLLHSGSLALDPADSAVVTPFLQWVVRQGIALSIDINVRLAAISDVAAYRTTLPGVLALARFIKASDEDLAALYPQLSLSAAVNTLRAIAPSAMLLLTAGAAGATLYQAERQLFCPAQPPERFVDTVGAGDTFFACFLATLADADVLVSPAPAATLSDNRRSDSDNRFADSLLSDTLLQRALQRAVTAASLNIAQRGCVPPSRAEIDAALP